MERCPNCGNRLSNIDVLCPRCGAVVEVIQIKSSISSAPETGGETKTNPENSVHKKEFPKNFIVYNEDFPAEEPGTDTFTNTENTDDALKQLEPAGAAEHFSEPQGAYAEEDNAAAQQTEQRENTIQNYIEKAGISEEETNDYSERYVEHLKDINLPEIDDLQNFDPEEFMREYRLKNQSLENAADNTQPNQATKQWLEIEEAYETDYDPGASQINAQGAEPSADTDRQARRYRSTKNNNLSRKNKKETVKRSKEKKYNVALTVLLWLAVSAAFLCGFLFFDKYVQTAYGGYDSFIYTITDGKIDLNDGN